MKHTKVFLWLIVFLIITYNVSSQYAPITTVSSTVACPGDTVILHLTQTNLDPLSFISLERFIEPRLHEPKGILMYSAHWPVRIPLNTPRCSLGSLKQYTCRRSMMVW